jgi:hypothetical protein
MFISIEKNDTTIKIRFYRYFIEIHTNYNFYTYNIKVLYLFVFYLI